MITEGIVLMLIGTYLFIYYLIYKNNSLFGNLLFIFVSVGSFLFTTGNEQMVSLVLTIASLGKLVLDFFQKK
jgi:hypothetical protein